jgi:hypothetical protein
MVSGSPAVLWVGGTALVILITALVFLVLRRGLLRASRHQKFYVAADGDPFKLTPGKVVVVGIVESIDDGPAGSRPFLLDLGGGARVLVEPADAPSPVSLGARVHVRGHLRTAIPREEGVLYREAPRRAVIGPPLEVSAEGFLRKPKTDLDESLWGLVAMFMILQLLYAGFWIDCVSYWLGGSETPVISGGWFSMVFLVLFSFWLGIVISTRRDRPWSVR